MILTLIPIRPFYQTSAGMASVGEGRLRMRRPASLSTVSLQALSIYDLYVESTETRRPGSAGGGECRRRPSAHASACWLHDHFRKVTLSHTKNQDVGDRSGSGA